jgi:hypothetical protein
MPTPIRSFHPKVRQTCVLAVTLHNRLSETLLALPESFVETNRQKQNDTADEILIDFVASLHRPESNVLGFWVYVLNPVDGVSDVHHFLTPLQVLAHSVVQSSGQPSKEQICASLDYDMRPILVGKKMMPPPLPSVLWVSQIKIIFAKPQPASKLEE